MENNDLTPRELKYKKMIMEMKERDRKHNENYPFHERGGGNYINRPIRIVFFFILLIVMNLFLGYMLMSVPKTVMNICLIGGFMAIVSILVLVTIIKSINEWVFLSKYEKKVADSYSLFVENDENGQSQHILEFTVSSRILDPVTHKHKITHETAEKIRKLGYLPVTLILGVDCYDYDLDLKQLNKLTKNLY